MSSQAEAAGSVPQAPEVRARTRFNPTICFWIAGAILYGGAAANFAFGHFLDQMSRDLWQHLAALRALIEDPVNPINPFVATNDMSRHFNPYWLGMAAFARMLGWDEWQAIIFAGFASAGVLLAGIYAFGRAFYRDERGPLALLAAMVVGWLAPVSHTGYHSMGTLIEGIAYPAALLIGLSFLLWALIIRCMRVPRWTPLILPLAALMFATHQVGAIIGFIVAGWLILLWPKGKIQVRAWAFAALGAGALIAGAWPYVGAFDAILRAGNVKWAGGPDWYSVGGIIAAFVPQIVGLAGLRYWRLAGAGLPILASLLTFLAIYLCGLAGVMIATRFIMPVVLMLHIGMGALFLMIARNWRTYKDWRKLAIFGVAPEIFLIQHYLTWQYLSGEATAEVVRGNAYVAARTITSDIPDLEPVAVYDVAVWPVVATGQRAMSVPWPEPGIPDLNVRQASAEKLFDPQLTRAERLALARQWGVRTLIIDESGPLRRKMPPNLLRTLGRQSVQFRQVGPYVRFDLY